MVKSLVVVFCLSAVGASSAQGAAAAVDPASCVVGVDAGCVLAIANAAADAKRVELEREAADRRRGVVQAVLLVGGGALGLPGFLFAAAGGHFAAAGVFIGSGIGLTAAGSSISPGSD